MTGVLSVVIPAHDEKVSLPALLAALADEGFEVVVVPNGCTDGTAAEARRAVPAVTVVEIPEASKAAALRAGDGVAHHFPRFYLDADVTVSAEGLRRLADALRTPGVLAVAPTVVFDTSAASWPVRSFYRALAALPAVSGSLAGTGCMGLSRDGRARFDDWPQVLADDYYLDGLFGSDEKLRVPGVTSRVRTPRRLADLVRRRTRVAFGNRQVERLGLRAAGRAGGAGVLAAARRHPARIAVLVVFALVGLVVRARVAAATWGGREVGWNRDDSRVTA